MSLRFYESFNQIAAKMALHLAQRISLTALKSSLAVGISYDKGFIEAIEQNLHSPSLA
jgi:hypothetical protein